MLIFLLKILGMGLPKERLPKKDRATNIILAVGIAVTVISWFVTGYLNNRQSVLQRKREIKVRMLTDAYFKLQNLKDREAYESPVNAYIYYKYSEEALDEIQLIGDNELVGDAELFTKSLPQGGTAFQTPLNNLLIKLRNDLRRELNVESINDPALNPFQLRVKRNARLSTQDSLTSQEEINLIIRLNEDHKDLFK